MPAFVSDGYTSSAYIRGADGLCEPVRFQYRPASRSEIMFWRHDRNALSAAELVKRDGEFAAKHVISWDICSKGQAVPVSAENFSRLDWNLGNRILEILCQTEAGDTMPDGPESQPIDMSAATKN